MKNWQELSDVEKKLVSHFDNFTTYFTGFHENRANMYTDKAKHSSIAYRIIHENLPIFLTNKKLFETIKQKAPQLAQETQNALLEHLNGAIVEDMFELSYFNYLLSQTHINLYNQMIGGIKQDSLKIQGLNEKINLYRQANGLSKRELPNLKPLHKQILSDRETLSWLPEAFESNEELVQSVQNYYENEVLAFECCDGKVNLLKKLPDLLSQTQDYDLSKIYFKNALALTTASQVIFKDYRIMKEALWEVNKPKKSKDLVADEERFFNRKNSYFSIEEIDNALKDAKLSASMMQYFQSESSKNIEQIQVAYNEWKCNSSNKELLKAFLDALLAYQRLLKPLNAPNDREKDVAFYAYFDAYFGSLNGVVKLYDKVRNFMTKKPYSLEKFKLNFESGYLLNGWSQEYETRAGLLFEKEGMYYLGINVKKLTENEKSYLTDNSNGNSLKRVILDFQKPDNKNIPRLFIRSKGDNFAPAVNAYNLPIQSVIEIYDLGKFKTEYRKTNPDDYKYSLHKLIDYFKQGFLKHESYKHYNFGWKETNKYLDIAEFYKDVETSCYEVKYETVNWDRLIEYVADGKLYLFQIYNKDFSPFSQGTPNMHTLYWRALFDEKNLADVIYKLNGQAEIFFRKKSIEYSQEKLQKGHHHEMLKSKFTYPIIKDRRFAFDKFQFHVPITLNFKSSIKVPSEEKFKISFNTKINENVKNFIAKNSNIRVIGIDRGERHLLYLSLIDAKGKIVEQFTLNEIVNSYNGKEHSIDYHAKLDAKEKDRDKARKEWGVVENIKELKEGYLSHVIHKIATLIVEHGAVLAMEDLNFGFKRGRFKVEKQVYQKFEKALIDKLNYLIDKKQNKLSLGGVLNALQLSGVYHLESLEKLKQSGFLFYVPAWNTSKIDPVTGFVNLFDTRYASVEKSKAFFAKFKTIRYNEAKDYFEFSFDYNDFTDKAKETRSEWTLCTYGERIVSFRNAEKNHQWDSKTISLTAEFKNLFGALHGNDIKAYILEQNSTEFFKSLMYLLKITLQMRNSITGTDIDYLVSPVADEAGNFYDSRKTDRSLPKDADANGAYNIARKGLILMQRIQKAEDLKKVNLAISNRDWLRYAQGLV